MLPDAFDHRRYVPVILTRQGERHALRVLSPAVREAMTPLFVVHPVELDLGTREPKKTVEDHLDKIAEALAKDWGVGPAFVDLRHVDTSYPLASGVHPLVAFVNKCLSLGLPLAPVVSGAHSADYRLAAADAARDAGTSVGIRLGPAEWANLGTGLGDGHLAMLLTETDFDPSDVHMIIDVEDQVSTTVEVTAAALRPALRALPHAHEWASLTVAGTGMPDGTASVGANNVAELPRLEWALWRLLSGPENRQPSFGDYCVQHPNPQSDFNPRFMDSSAQLRYTIDSNWFVARGRGVKATGNAQIHDLARLVVAHPQFSGAAFSWGDEWLDNCANNRCTPANQGTWRKVTTNHHLKFVVTELASLFGT